ncbi:MAG: polysaccharide biosynthesis protein [Myxococcales bacterium]|nr:polysaccharide biosynthesis protein [Myxococcales bacterium]
MSEPTPQDLQIPALVFTYRRLLVVGVHLVLWCAATVGAFVLRFDGHVSPWYWERLAIWIPVGLALRTAIYFYFGLFHGLWRYTGVRDLLSLFKAASLSTAAMVLYVALIGPGGVPRSVYIIEWLLSVFAVGGLRMGIRTLRELSRRAALAVEVGPRRILVVGAGDAGEMLVREIIKTHQGKYEVVGFVDDDASKQRLHIHDVRVLGPIAKVTELVKQHAVDEVIVAIPSARADDMRRIVAMCGESGAAIRTIPGVDALVDGRVAVNQIRPVKIEDLLGRAPVTLDSQAIADCVNGAVVLVTGAGGSIGAELCRQVCRFGPAQLVLVEQAENAMFQIHRELHDKFPHVKLVPRIADICDTRRLEAVFQSMRPSVVFHAAAHKHVPMMEWNPGEAIKNNVFGTKKVADLAVAYDVQQFVMISTDKAVNPTSIMGVSKRVAEIYCQALSQRTATRFITVRFGNVLGSNGSVVPIFQEQIARGGPVTVTHPEMKRYFMTIPEACQLVMQAGAMGKGGEIFVLDMGEPVKIVDLAKALITLSGLRPGEDIEIQFSGIRPGEKLFEELAADEERADKTQHPKIFVGRFRPYRWEDVVEGLEALHQCTDGVDDATVRQRFLNLVPEFKPMVLPARDGATSQRLAAVGDTARNVIPLKR